MRHPLIRTLVAGAAVLAVAAIGAPAASAADPGQTVVTTTSGGMGEVACDPQATGNDNDPTKATGNKNGDYVPEKNGYGKVEGAAWTAGNVPGLSWTISGKTISITFDATFDAKAYPISDILVKGGNGYVVCHTEFYLEAGDTLTLSTAAIGLKNGGKNAPDISHVSFYPGDAQWRPTEPQTPECTSVGIGTVALSVGDGNPNVSTPGNNWFGAFAYTGGTQTAYLYAGNNKNGQHTPVGQITLTSEDGKVVVAYQLNSDAAAGWYYEAVEVRYDSAANVASILDNGTFAPGQHLVGPSGTSGVIKVAEVAGAPTYVIIHLDVAKVTCR